MGCPLSVHVELALVYLRPGEELTARTLSGLIAAPMSITQNVLSKGIAQGKIKRRKGYGALSLYSSRDSQDSVPRYDPKKWLKY